MHQADGAPRQGAQQRFRGAHVARIVIGGPQGLGYARQVNHGIGATNRLLDALAADEIAVDGFDPGGQAARASLAAQQAAHGLARRGQFVQQMAADEAGPASDQNHYRGALRKATSPK